MCVAVAHIASLLWEKASDWLLIGGRAEEQRLWLNVVKWGWSPGRQRRLRCGWTLPLVLSSVLLLVS